MSDPRQSLAKTDYRLTDVLDLFKKEIMMNLNCHAIGTIQSVDLTKQTVVVKVSYLKSYMALSDSSGAAAANTYSQKTMEYKPLLDCPFVCMNGGNFSLTIPIAIGDTCLILFNDRDIDDWHHTNQLLPVASQRFHSMSDAIALVGIRSSVNPIANYSSDHMQMVNGNVKLGISSSKVLVSNGADKLSTLLNDLVNEIKNLVSATAAITVTCASPGSPSTPPLNVSTITAISSSLTSTASKIAGLLE